MAKDVEIGNLVVSRRKGEKIKITLHGLTIEATVVRISADAVRMAFRGPRCIEVLRSELVDKIPQ